MGEKERGRGTEDGRKRTEERIGKWDGKRGGWKGRKEKVGKGTFARLRLSSGYALFA